MVNFGTPKPEPKVHLMRNIFQKGEEYLNQNDLYASLTRRAEARDEHFPQEAKALREFRDVLVNMPTAGPEDAPTSRPQDRR